MPLMMAVFLVIGLGLAGLVIKTANGDPGILGGPESLRPFSLSGSVPGALSGGLDLGIAEAAEESIPTSEDNAVLIAQPRLRTGGQENILSYTTKTGDTLVSVAADFGISIETILQANSLRGRALKAGQELLILPVSGVLYRVKEGDTPESLSSTYRIPLAKLKEFNGALDFNNFAPGMLLVMPGVSPKAADFSNSLTPLPLTAGYFSRPTEGFNWGKLHSQNAVDIANACGTPIKTAAEGLVVKVVIGEWNSGYGNSVMIEHPNGVKTNYAHLEKATVNVGDYLQNQAQIGTMGRTGEATGCHLHFEVRGAKNPFAR